MAAAKKIPIFNGTLKEPFHVINIISSDWPRRIPCMTAQVWCIIYTDLLPLHYCTGLIICLKVEFLNIYMKELGTHVKKRVHNQLHPDYVYNYPHKSRADVTSLSIPVFLLGSLLTHPVIIFLICSYSPPITWPTLSSNNPQHVQYQKILQHRMSNKVKSFLLLFTKVNRYTYPFPLFPLLCSITITNFLHALLVYLLILSLFLRVLMRPCLMLIGMIQW